MIWERLTGPTADVLGRLVAQFGQAWVEQRLRDQGEDGIAKKYGLGVASELKSAGAFEAPSPLAMPSTEEPNPVAEYERAVPQVLPPSVAREVEAFESETDLMIERAKRIERGRAPRRWALRLGGGVGGYWLGGRL